MLGEVIGNYRITGKLSEGGMGMVFRAEHALLGRAAAIKLILPVWSENREIVQRFFTEAKVTSSIRHPGIVEIFDFGYHADGRAFLVMELLAGEPLSRRVSRQGRMDEISAVVLGRSIAGALAAAHARGVVHRDLKPDNVFLVPDPDMPTGERPKILDFGIAKLADARNHSGATRTGVVMGTPAYMSPEQCRGAGAVDARADLYSLGCILYELVAGRPPFVAEGSGELIGAHLFMPPPPLREHAPAVSPELEAVVMRLLAKDPDHRQPGALDVAAELAAIAASIPGVPPSWRVMAPTPMPIQLPAATTLGGAAGASPTAVASPARRGAWAVLASLVAGAAVAVAFLAGRAGGGPTAEPAPAVSAHEVPAEAPPPVLDAGVAVVATEAPVDAGAAVAVDAEVEVVVTRTAKKKQRKGRKDREARPLAPDQPTAPKPPSGGPLGSELTPTTRTTGGPLGTQLEPAADHRSSP